MMLAKADEVDAHPIGELTFRDDVADDLRMGEQGTIGAGRDIAKRVDAEFKLRSALQN